MHHCPLTRICVTRIFNGVPLGVQIAWLSCSSTGWPLALTRVAAVTHVAVTQGVGAPPVTYGQPATT
ncbi:MAG: hypothetical protein PVG32_09090 [Anaerolineales bacterium]